MAAAAAPCAAVGRLTLSLQSHCPPGPAPASTQDKSPASGKRRHSSEPDDGKRRRSAEPAGDARRHPPADATAAIKAEPKQEPKDAKPATKPIDKRLGPRLFDRALAAAVQPTRGGSSEREGAPRSSKRSRT